MVLDTKYEAFSFDTQIPLSYTSAPQKGVIIAPFFLLVIETTGMAQD
jgi:hypothetical protein